MRPGQISRKCPAARLKSEALKAGWLQQLSQPCQKVLKKVLPVQGKNRLLRLSLLGLPLCFS